ncbi:diacylglycerol kinase family protein [Corynebacterium mendelii]|uniref:Diacylglycerol kinase n=1 Tax=Corynebacterium mendelii TaxID=2765362 RepID=A0A939IVG0_9CORY|nr:diacylglycerol kinase family protein [Corynebacterium mendelii]MBN9644196.1 diacylglycerol kinase [Corynebacterium mendelii]
MTPPLPPADAADGTGDRVYPRKTAFPPSSHIFVEPSHCPAPFQAGFPAIASVFPKGQDKDTVLGGAGMNYAMGFERINSVAVLTNPHSGKGSGMSTMGRALDRFRQLGVTAVAYHGTGPHDSRRLAREAMADGRFDAIVVCGGDGMINLVLQETAASGFPVGIIASGTGNDHARALGIPHQCPEMAVEVIAAGFTSTFDLGLVTGGDGSRNWFGTVACVGLDAAISERTNKMSWPTGATRYYAAIIRELVGFTPARYTLTLDGAAPIGALPPAAKKHLQDQLAASGDRLVIDRPLVLAAFSNTGTYGGGMKIAPYADDKDGLLDITVVEACSRRQLIANGTKFFSGALTSQPEYASVYRCRKATVEAAGASTCFADGDPMSPLPVTIECVAGAGRFIVPVP